MDEIDRSVDKVKGKELDEVVKKKLDASMCGSQYIAGITNNQLRQCGSQYILENQQCGRNRQSKR